MPRDRIIRACCLLTVCIALAVLLGMLGHARGLAQRGELPALPQLRGSLP